MPCRQTVTFNGTSGSGQPGGGGYATEAECLQACKEGACCGVRTSPITLSVSPQCQCQGGSQRFLGVGISADNTRRRICCYELFESCIGLPADWKTNTTTFGVFPATLAATLTISESGAADYAQTEVVSEQRQAFVQNAVSLSGSYTLDLNRTGNNLSSHTCATYIGSRNQGYVTYNGYSAVATVTIGVGFGFGDSGRSVAQSGQQYVPQAYPTVSISPFFGSFNGGYGDSPCTFNPYVAASSCWTATSQIWTTRSFANPSAVPCNQRFVQIATLSVSSQ